jgi:hypothetical protein
MEKEHGVEESMGVAAKMPPPVVEKYTWPSASTAIPWGQVEVG